MKNKKECREYVHKILAKLNKAGLYTNVEKCEFNIKKTMFLGFIIPVDSIEIDSTKINTILH